MAPRALNGKESLIHDLLVQMSEATDKAIEDALQCFMQHDVQFAEKIIAGDEAINRLQHQIEEECLTTIARHQPVARDLRDLVADTYIALELERIADHAADIARIVLKMQQQPITRFNESILSLGQQCRSMLANALASYQGHDVQKARELAAKDDEVDYAEQRIIDEILAYLCSHSQESKTCTYTLWVVHNLERIGDRVTNIAERVIFIVTGENVDLNR